MKAKFNLKTTYSFIYTLLILFILIWIVNFNIVECIGEQELSNIPQAIQILNPNSVNVPVYTTTGQYIAVPEVPQNLVENANNRPQEGPLLQENNKCLWVLICCGCIPY